MRRLSFSSLWIVAPLVLVAWTVFHIELRESLPQAGQVLAEAPEEIWLKFSVPPETALSTFSERDPEGGVQLDNTRWCPDDDPTVLRARVEGEMPPGDYLISWAVSPVNDNGGRGRIGFSITEGR